VEVRYDKTNKQRALEANGRPSSVTSMRKVTDPNGFKFSNGIALPYGTSVSVLSDAVHRDTIFYDNPDTFDGFRFYNLRKANLDEGEDEYQVKHAFSSQASNWLFWGVGKHACPGR